ncbi:LysR family transcriptional regulator [Yersinia aldovae]|uniref:LysR family transcriptional regulator n=1 Tax=Yersinia aldovae TaxID=29483 RepID=UPI0005AD295B|nr:LysR family transcriptional regulator [Yersinia aldovae]AJJ64572.1 bacterial regulatory helix-turn-helix, lysR family protein [Yersinia aldovae 670-83]
MKSSLDLNLTRILCAIVETGTVSLTAERLDMSISAVSVVLNKLRKHYNDPIVFRGGNGMQPTALTLELYKIFKPALEMMDSGVNKTALLNEQGVAMRTVRIRSSSLVEFWLLGYMMQNPPKGHSVSYEFLSNQPSGQKRIELLRRRQIDIDIGFSLENDSAIQRYPLFQSNSVLICRRDHPRIKDAVTFDELKAEELLGWILPQDAVEKEQYLVSFDDIYTVHRTYRSTSFTNLLIHAAHSDAVMFVPAPFAPQMCAMLPLRTVKTAFLDSSKLSIYAHIHKAQKADPVLQHIIGLFSQLAGAGK